ncbi:kinase-like domain-containing protein [Gigaspora rosea]|uniref:Kinase-like domain-containing protein n=1 Tax=Gigaspora rosea TaxID=44941 RepID=A0A397VXN6_9GLOM|nr:kinase-like domain-containing protein [Gigaspora rosea]
MQSNNSIIYGITKDGATSKGYMIVVSDEFNSKRKKSYGQCEHCKHYNTSLAWCQSCDIWKTTQELTKWTSGDKYIINCIKEFQLNATEYEKVIEWIPFNRLTNLQKISEKESEILFMATWLDGIRKVENNKQSRVEPCGVNLKKLPSSQMDALEFIKEFKNHMQLNCNTVYGITKDDATSNGFMIVLDEFSTIRNESYGICESCKQYNTSEEWCQSCDPWKTTQGWTSGDENIDDCIKDFQLKATAYRKIIGWIPFDRLQNLQEIGRGGFSKVYSAEWFDGKRILNIEDDKYERSRQPLFSVALKTLKLSPNPQTNSFEFLRKFKYLIQCGSELEIYGITKDAKTEEYLMVHQYANSGNLHEFLSKYFKELKWLDKLKLLVDITKDLMQIHGNGNIHNNMHGGNILIDQDLQYNLKPYISDPETFRGKDEHDSKSEIYGVMPYVAPEVLLGEQPTQAADIYSLGIIMAEMSTGKRSCVGHPFDENLAIEIINKNWLPEFAKGTPDLYIELANQCMNSDPQKRPIAKDVYDKLNEWCNKITGSDDTNNIKKNS